MRRFLIILNLILSVLAGYLTLYLLRSSIGAHGVAVAPESQYPIADEHTVNQSVATSDKMSRQQSDVLWTRNLFHPDRSFDETMDEIKISTPDEVNEHFELISIAQVSKNSCASIRVILDKRRQRRRPARSRRRGTASRQSKSKNKDQKIYMLNDSVGETGFILAEIGIDFVVLKRNEQEITLRLDKGDDASEKRREVALKVASKAAAKEKAKKAAVTTEVTDNERKKAKSKKAPVSAHPPPPPPPPPVVAKPSAQSNVTSQSSRKEILREEYLKKVAEQSRREGSGK